MNITVKEKIMVLSALLTYEDKFREMYETTQDKETKEKLDKKIMQIKHLSMKLGTLFT